jgi:hypothetical protein
MAEKIAQLAFNNKQLLTWKHDFNIGICWFYTKQTLRSKNKNWLAQSRNKVLVWSDMIT